MKSLTLLYTVLTFAIAAVLSGPTPVSVPIEVYDGEKTGRHIVTLEANADRASILSKVGSLLATKEGMGITHEWNHLNGFAGRFDAATLAALQETPGVEFISEDGIVQSSSLPIQDDAPWGLARLSSNERLGCEDKEANFKYLHNPLGGLGVNIYIIDTGINTNHTDFGGRAHWGKSFIENLEIDDNGHGTHCAGTAVGHRFGVAKAAEVYAVKVLSGNGSGSIATVMSGMDFVKAEASKSGKPTVASMSLGGGANNALDEAVRSLISSGVHVVVAAGNNNGDANEKSPARVEQAITVGASDIMDARASFSNFGSVVDVFAPGVNVISTWNESNTATRALSGTSMATPHVAGLVAYLLSLNKTMTPFDMSEKIKGTSLKGLLNPYSLPADTANLVVNNGFPTSLPQL